MESNNNLINRRRMLAALGAAGVTGFAALGSLGKNTDDKNQMMGAAEIAGMDENKKTKFKTIGVLGGIGPQATMEFEARVHQIAQRLIPSQQNGGYPPMVVYYHRHPPILVNDDMMPKLPIQPDPRLLEAAKIVGAAADFIVITSNGAHLLQTEVER